MVTFALPGDFDAGTPTSTPKSRPPLPFAKRTYVATPYATKRFGTPQSSARKAFTTRDEVPTSSLNHSTMPSSRNIFRASTVNDSPSVTPFSPSLPQSTMKKVFAPGVTPEPNRVYRESVAKATPRGVASHAAEKDLFSMRIASPPPELTGEVLANKVPKDWNSSGSIYADQFLSHLCPPDLDEEQRRQFFCILDLRRLKYAANEIFANKTWKLNIINFAKEFEKSRSIILLRYGLYEFQNVRPSKEVLRRWRREHGLPDPLEDEADEAEPTPTKPAMSKKRKANENLTKDTAEDDSTARLAKRRTTVSDEADEPTASTPAPSANKRKASLSEEQPSKIHRPAPSSAKSLFEKIANKSMPAPAATPVKSTLKLSDASAAAKPSIFGTPATAPPKRSLFSSAQASPAPAATPNGNIFGYLSDASSAKHGGMNGGMDGDADADSETDSEQEDSQGAGQSDEQSGMSTAAGVSDSASSSFNTQPGATGLASGESSAPETRESTPGRSLFDRVTKDKDGQPLRAADATPDEKPVEKPVAAPLNQTWNPSTTPLKFAPLPSAATNSLFGLGASTSNNLFAPKASATSNLFATPKASDKGAPKTVDVDKSGGESDKENDSRPSKKSATEARPALQPSGSSSLFSNKFASSEVSKAAGSPKPATSLFGSTAKPDASSTSNLFGTFAKEAPAAQPSSLFAPKPAEPVQKEEKKAGFELPKTNSLFGASSATGTPANLFAPKPQAATTGNSLFGTTSSAPSTSLFSTSAAPAPAPAPAASPGKTATPPVTQPAAAPLFNFGATSTKPTLTSQAAATSLFGAPKSPPTSSEANMQGSPMKQDEFSPAKKPFGGVSSDVAKAAPIFSFSAPSAAPAAPSLFGTPATSAAPANVGATSNIFGGTSASNAASGPGSFNFSFGAPSTSSANSSFNNPFASGKSESAPAPAAAPAASSGSLFSFGASAAPGGGGSGSMFQFGGANGASTTTPSAPIFGGASSSGSGPTFGGSTAAPQSSSNIFTFGGSQPAPSFGANLQPPAGGSSTTGTNSPFNLGEGSSLATTPAGGTPEPSTQAAAAKTSAADNNDEDGEKHEQISLTEGAEKDEEILHEVRAKVLKFVSGDADGEEKKTKPKSPWVTQGVGPLRLLKHKETNAVRLLLRAEPRGNVVLNRLVLPSMSYKADEKYVKLTTSNDAGDGLETWMIQVKTKDLAKTLADALEEAKEFNKKT